MVCVPTLQDMREWLADSKGMQPPEEPLYKGQLHQQQVQQQKQPEHVQQVKPPSFLHLPPSLSHPTGLPSRRVIGFVTHGGFSLSKGQGAAQAFVSATGLREVVKVWEEASGGQCSGRKNNNNKNSRHPLAPRLGHTQMMVLMRIPSSRLYRPCVMEIL